MNNTFLTERIVRKWSKKQITHFLSTFNEHDLQQLQLIAQKVSQQKYQNKIYIRGLIEFTNYCKNDCFYCGLRCSNHDIKRYRLTLKEILECCEIGNKAGIKTFVLQGGEDLFYTDDLMVEIISTIRYRYPDCAISLSIGERSKESYKRFFDAGANRFLLRHETINPVHYHHLHPKSLTINTRVKCLKNLKKIGYQVGCGMMVGSPFQTIENIAEDIIFIKKFKPEMIGIGPFLSQKHTPFKKFENGDLNLTLATLSILRIQNPLSLIPSTTALSTLSKEGRILGILHGANVVMLNLSPLNNRKLYALYNNKVSTNEEAVEGLQKLSKSLEKINYRISLERGDY